MSLKTIYIVFFFFYPCRHCENIQTGKQTFVLCAATALTTEPQYCSYRSQKRPKLAECCRCMLSTIETGFFPKKKRKKKSIMVTWWKTLAVFANTLLLRQWHNTAHRFIANGAYTCVSNWKHKQACSIPNCWLNCCHKLWRPDENQPVKRVIPSFVNHWCRSLSGASFLPRKLILKKPLSSTMPK